MSDVVQENNPSNSIQSETYQQYKEIFDFIKFNISSKDIHCSKNTVDVVKFVVDSHTKLEIQKLLHKLEQQKLLAHTVVQTVKYIVIGTVIFFLLGWIDNSRISQINEHFIKNKTNILNDCNNTLQN